MRRPILIVKAGTTFPDSRKAFGDFEAWTAGGMEIPLLDLVVAAVYSGAPLPEPDSVSGVVVTGSSAMVTDREAWSERIAGWIPGVIEREVPFLGICYGHQLLAHAMGGEVGYHPGGREVGTVAVGINERGKTDALLGGLPEKLLAHTIHAQSALRLPEGTQVLAGNAFEPHHAFRVGACAWGVQFHPEFTAAVMRSYLAHQEAVLKAEGKDVNGLNARVVDTPQATSILRRFVEIVQRRDESDGKGL